MFSSMTFPRAVKHTAAPVGETLRYKSSDLLLAPSSCFREQEMFVLKQKNVSNITIAVSSRQPTKYTIYICKLLAQHHSQSLSLPVWRNGSIECGTAWWAGSHCKSLVVFSVTHSSPSFCLVFPLFTEMYALDLSAPTVSLQTSLVLWQLETRLCHGHAMNQCAVYTNVTGLWVRAALPLMYHSVLYSEVYILCSHWEIWWQCWRQWA